MTQWVESAEGGRDRGPRAVLRAWFEVATAPSRFYRTGVAPGDQAPGLTFAMLVVLVAEATRFALVPDAYPVIADSELLSGALWLGVAVLLVAPAGLHLLAAVETLLLAALAPDRGGVSETVQVLGYATAPCVFAGIPTPEVRAVCGVYAFALLVVGVGVVHRVSTWRAFVLSLVPGVVAYGYGFRALAAIETLLRNWFII
ncbi:YIP1 family protein [Halorubellus sp. PRR65]|uniref:YIP1 family protein n=1 Tax=Halorubellus sp. PRR65 TaxID=3098148 RepID=UPI002B2579D3|nr:YIP1 family protein [Halorubellus sp. PRR65]